MFLLLSSPYKYKGYKYLRSIIQNYNKRTKFSTRIYESCILTIYVLNSTKLTIQIF